MQEVLFDSQNAYGVWRRRAESSRLEEIDARAGEINHYRSQVDGKTLLADFTRTEGEIGTLISAEVY